MLCLPLQLLLPQEHEQEGGDGIEEEETVDNGEEEEEQAVVGLEAEEEQPGTEVKMSVDDCKVFWKELNTICFQVKHKLSSISISPSILKGSPQEVLLLDKDH